MDKIKPYPWLTKGAVEFLEGYLTEDMTVLEYGAGSSTVWMAKRVKRIYSIEHQLEWYDLVKYETRKDKNVYIQHRELPYDDFDYEFDDFAFDFILVDGRGRVECFRKALKYLRPGGIIMLDNSERTEYKECFEMVKGWKQWDAYGPDYEGTFNYENWKTSWWRKT